MTKRPPTDDEVLREDVEAGRAPGGGLERRAGRDVEAEAMAVAVLLGGVYDAGRVAIIITGDFCIFGSS